MAGPPTSHREELPMLKIVQIALQLPLTFIVLSILLPIVGLLAAFRTPGDIFPAIRIPVIAAAWTLSLIHI